MDHEGKFIHDISTPVGTLLLVIESMLDDAQNQPTPDAKQISKLESAMKNLNKIRALIDERKKNLVEQAKN